MMSADPATEDDGDLVGLADCSIGVKQPLPEVVQRCPSMKDQVVAVLDLREAADVDSPPPLAPELPELGCSACLPKPSAKLGTARQCPAACSGSRGKVADTY